MAQLPTVNFKSGVTLIPTPALARMLWAVQCAAVDGGIVLEVTAGSNGHEPPSRHCTGEALDLSVAGMDVPTLRDVLEAIAVRLGESFSAWYEIPTSGPEAPSGVVCVVNEHATAPHIHIQVRKGIVFPYGSGQVRV